MDEMYVTIAGCNHYFGTEFMEKGMKVKLEKEPDNEHDKEAILVKVKGLEKCDYVANSPYTVQGESMSAGRLYDKIGDQVKEKIVFVIPGATICKITRTGMGEIEPEDIENEEGQTWLEVKRKILILEILWMGWY